MYGDYKGYGQEYDTGYSEEIEGGNQFYYDYNTEPTMMMNQPRSNRGIPQFRNQQYMGYQMNQPFAQNMPNSFNQKHQMYPAQPRNMHNRADMYQQSPSPQYAGSNQVNQPQMSSYQPPQASSQFVSIETHEMLIKQYKLTLTMIRAQNNAVIEKLKMQIKKMNEQYKMVKDWILSGDTNDIGQNRQQKFMENFNNLNNQFPQQNIVDEYKQTDLAYNNFHQDFQPAQSHVIPNRNEPEPELAQSARTQLLNKLSPHALLLERKIRSLNQKKTNEKIKIQNIQKPLEANLAPSLQKSQKDNMISIENKSKNKVPSVSDTRSHKQKHYEEQDNLDPEQPMYPDDYEGEQSFLVDDEVEEKQRMKKLKNHPKANTFGIQSPELIDFSFRSDSKSQELQKESLVIEEFFDDFLCQNILYAPKKEFLKYRINKTELYKIYAWWCENQKGQINLLFDKKTIQGKITKEINKRFASCKEERESFAGLMFKDHSIHKMMSANSQVLSV